LSIAERAVRVARFGLENAEKQRVLRASAIAGTPL